MATTWLSTSEMRAWRNFIESISTLTAALENDLSPYGLTMGDYEVLVRLSEADDQRLRMCDLATSLQLSPSGLTRRCGRRAPACPRSSRPAATGSVRSA